MSFPVAGTLMVEPTESESLAELDRFCDAMIAIRAEIAEIERGEIAHDDSALAHAPHTAEDLLVADWDRPYTREQAAYPVRSLRRGKYWPPGQPHRRRLRRPQPRVRLPAPGGLRGLTRRRHCRAAARDDRTGPAALGGPGGYVAPTWALRPGTRRPADPASGSGPSSPSVSRSWPSRVSSLRRERGRLLRPLRGRAPLLRLAPVRQPRRRVPRRRHRRDDCHLPEPSPDATPPVAGRADRLVRGLRHAHGVAGRDPGDGALRRTRVRAARRRDRGQPGVRRAVPGRGAHAVRPAPRTGAAADRAGQPWTRSAISSSRNGGPLTRSVRDAASRASASRSSRILSLRADQVDVLDHRGRHAPRRPRPCGRRGRRPGSSRTRPRSRAARTRPCGSCGPWRPCRRCRGRASGRSRSAQASTSSPDDRRHHAGHLEVVGGAPGARAGEALGQRLAVEAVGLGREEHRQPAVADLGRQGHVLRALGAEVDRDVGAQRAHDRLERLAEPGAARRGASGSARPTYSTGFSRAMMRRTMSTYSRVRASGLAYVLAVPALDHLRPATRRARG